MNNVFDFLKRYPNLYNPGIFPSIVDIPKMKFLAIEGKGDPNKNNGEYEEAFALLNTVSFKIKMSKINNYNIDGYFEYIMPPLEGFWWFENGKYKKDDFLYLLMIRQPEFVTKSALNWALKELKTKKNIDASKVKLIEFSEGKCVQITHRGTYNNAFLSINRIKEYIAKNNLREIIGEKIDNDLTKNYHEIYLTDPKKGRPENAKMIIRIPVGEITFFN